MNPAALKANLRRPRARRHAASSTPTRSTSATSTRPATPANPLERRQPRGLHGVRGADDVAHASSAAKALGVKPRDAERSKNFFALGLVSWMYTRPVEPTLEWIDGAVRREREQVADANTAAFKAGYNFGETAELFDHPYEVKPAHARARARTRTSPATPRWRGGSSPPASWRSCRCSSRRTRSRRRPTSSTSCRSTRTSACARCRPKTRSPASAPRSAPRSAGTRRHDDERPGIDAEVRDDGPRGQPRAAAA